MEENAEAFIIEGKYVVFFMTEENGLTTDGYLPIFEDIYIDETTTLKAGIYSAFYDEQENK